MTSIAETKTKHNAPAINPWLILMVGIAAGTFAAPFIKLAQDGGLPSPVVASGRMLLAAIIITPYVWFAHRDELMRLDRRDLIFAMLAGVFLQTHFQLFILALETTSVLVVVVLLNTGPLWVAIIARILLKEQINRYVWIGLMVTIFGGMYIAFSTVSGADAEIANPLFGATLSIFGAIAGAATLVTSRSVRQKVSLFPYVWVVFGFGGLVGLVYTILTSTPITGHPADGYFWLLMLTLVPQLIGHSSFNFVLGYISATMTSLSSQMITITASIAAFFMFAEVPTIGDMIGSGIIILGVLIAIVYRNHGKSTGKVKP
ncbi:MAG: DMT family transporter [Chloroflexota bacterium]